MPETELERIKGLEVTVGTHQKTIDDHEKRIDALEELSIVVGKLNDGVSRQGENIDKLMSVINDMKKTTANLELMQAKIETRQQYWFIDGMLTIVRKIGIKGFIAIGTVIAGIMTALHIWG